MNPMVTVSIGKETVRLLRSLGIQVREVHANGKVFCVVGLNAEQRFLLRLVLDDLAEILAAHVEATQSIQLSLPLEDAQ